MMINYYIECTWYFGGLGPLWEKKKKVQFRIARAS